MSKCETLQTWQVDGNTLQLDLEDNGAYVLRLYDPSVETDTQLADEIGMSPAIAVAVARAIIRHFEASK